MEKNYFSSNIKILLKYYGITSTKLAETIHVDKTTISKYTNTGRIPDSDTLQRIADYFAISREMLLRMDLSPLSDTQYTTRLGIPDIDILFPIIDCETNTRNVLFDEARSFQRSFYDKLANNDSSAFNYYDEFCRCKEQYTELIEDKTFRECAIANLVDLILLESMFYDTDIFQMNPVYFDLLKKAYPKMKIMDDFEREEYIREINGSKFEHYAETNEVLFSYIKILCESSHCSELGYFYLAMCYWVNYMNDEKGLVENQLIAAEMMKMLSMIGNKYASDFLSHFVS